MTLSEFNSLDLDDQLDVTWEKGILEDHNTHGDHFYLLYKIDEFFVEVAFLSETHDITEIKTFSKNGKS
jgi:hypothetical protein